MFRLFACLLVVSMLISGSAPAFAGVISPTVVSGVEDVSLTAQQIDDAPQIADVEGGDNEVLAAVGVILLVLILIGAAAGGG